MVLRISLLWFWLKTSLAKNQKIYYDRACYYIKWRVVRVVPAYRQAGNAAVLPPPLAGSRRMREKLYFSNNYFFDGELAEWSNAAVLKTVVLHGTGGSNPSLSAILRASHFEW